MERIQAAIRKAKEQRALLGGETGALAAPSHPPAQQQVHGTGRINGPLGTSPAPDAWAALAPFEPDPEVMRRSRIVAFDRSMSEHVTFDMLRTKILRLMREKGWTTLAVTSPTSGCGKTMISLNLAFSFAHQPESRTVLMELDLRRPSMAKTLRLTEGHSMASLLQREGGVAENFVRYGENLAIGVNDRAARETAELLHHPTTAQALAVVKNELRPGVLIFDLPPMLTCDDVFAFLPNVDCVLLVAAAEQTTVDEIDRCERELSEQTHVLGVLLNKCRYLGEGYGYYY